MSWFEHRTDRWDAMRCEVDGGWKNCKTSVVKGPHVHEFGVINETKVCQCQKDYVSLV